MNEVNNEKETIAGEEHNEAQNTSEGGQEPSIKDLLSRISALEEELQKRDKKLADYEDGLRTLKKRLAENKNGEVGIDPNSVVTKQELEDERAFIAAGIMDEEERKIVRTYAAGRPVAEALKDENVQLILENYRAKLKAAAIEKESAGAEASAIEKSDKQFMADFEAGKIEPTEENARRYGQLKAKYGN